MYISMIIRIIVDVFKFSFNTTSRAWSNQNIFHYFIDSISTKKRKIEMIVSMKNDAGLVRQVKVGFCWTALFFGPLPFFFRGMPANGLIWCCTLWFGNFILPFIMNKHTAHYYLEHGYKPIGHGWDVVGPQWGLALPANAWNSLRLCCKFSDLLWDRLDRIDLLCQPIYAVNRS